MPDMKPAKVPSDSFRVVKSGRKWMFVATVVVLVALISVISGQFGAGAFLAAVVCGVILIAVVVGARVFRASGELLETPRPWWKATGNTVLSLVLGGIAVWAFILQVFSAIYVESTDLEGYVVTRSLAVFTALLGAFYLHSGVRQAIADELGRRRIADPKTVSLLRPPFRLTTVGGKLVYLYVYWLVGFAIGPLTNWAVWPLGHAIDLAFVLIGIRIFRGRTEAIGPPRVWWRASGRPTASFVLGGFFAVTTALNLVSTIAGDREVFATTVEGVASVVEVAIVTAIYLNSAIRLTRLKELAPVT
jgi:hypothetical protein